MQSKASENLENEIFAALEATDSALEEKYGDRYSLHPARLPHGNAAARQYDGLFELSSGFTAGIGSRHGAGYAINFHLATLDRVSSAEREVFEAEAAEILRVELAKRLPERHLRVVRDTHGLKIVGDFSLTRQ